jgi:DNA-binding transcriptional ArsR family regulator
MIQFINLTKALSDENRVRIVMALYAREELCVCSINDLFKLAPSTVSKHLFLLKNASLVKARKDGRWMYYRLNREPDAPEMVTEALAWVVRSLAEKTSIKADRDRLESILCVPLTTACSS